MANYSSLESTYVCEEYWACKNAVDCYERITTYFSSKIVTRMLHVTAYNLLQILFAYSILYTRCLENLSTVVQKTSRPSEKSTLFFYSNMMSMFLWCLSLMDFIGNFCSSMGIFTITKFNISSLLNVWRDKYFSCYNSMLSKKLQSKFS